MKVLTEEEKHSVFLRAVCGFQGSKDRWAKRIQTGLTDEALKAALKYELGHFGGSGSRDSINIAYQGDGLKIWAGSYDLNPCLDAPLFEGMQTIKMARVVFNIADPSNLQIDLFGGL
jgi:hypothetical protein